MGLVIGIVIIPVGLIIPGWKNYLKVMLQAFICACGTALLIGIAALIYGLIKYNETNLPNFSIPNAVVDKINFCVVGNMHNFSYLGGIIGMVAGITFIIVMKLKLRRIAGHGRT
jgi:membrane-bound ClpP family serine protease